MPLRNIRMNFSTRNVQTTAYPTFTTTRRTNPNFSMNTGCCIKSRNPLIGWRKEKVCCDASQNTAGWQEVFKNVNGPDCCLPRNRSIQNTARSSPEQTEKNGGVPYKVSGKIDKSYNHNYRQYLKKRCKLAYYDQKGQSSFTFNNTNKQNNIGQAGCCGTYCGQYSNVATYKRSNWGFRRQGAVTANGYIAARGYKTSNFCCCPCTQVVAWDPTSGAPAPAVGDAVTQTGGASGIIISITGSATLDNFAATIRLDDCNKPFTNGVSTDLFVNGADQGTSGTGVTANEVIPCGPYSGRRRDYPRDPQNNPKNYNKKQY